MISRVQTRGRPTRRLRLYTLELRWFVLASIGDGGLAVIDGDEVVPFQIPNQRDVTTTTLHANGGMLWSIGTEHVLSFDGSKWVRHHCPENR